MKITSVYFQYVSGPLKFNKYYAIIVKISLFILRKYMNGFKLEI